METFIGLTKWDDTRARLHLCEGAYLLTLSELEELRDSAGDVIALLKAESQAPDTANAAEVAIVEGVEDNGTRLYTESETQELLYNERRDTLAALFTALDDWGWHANSKRSLLRKVKKIMDKRPEVSNA